MDKWINKQINKYPIPPICALTTCNKKPDTLHFDQLMARRSLNLPFLPHLLTTLTYKFPSRKEGGGGGGGGGG
jgi:hypothetical protein